MSRKSGETWGTPLDQYESDVQTWATRPLVEKLRYIHRGRSQVSAKKQGANLGHLRFGLVMLVAAACVLVGCHTTQPPVTQELIAGNYTFVSKDPESRATDHSLNHLVLQSNGTYDLVEGGTTKPVSEKKGVWKLEPGTPSDHVNVVLDHSGYPIEMKPHEVRLLVDLDTGVWWVKPR